MTEQEKETQIALGTYLPTVWKKRTEIRDKALEMYDIINRDGDTAVNDIIAEANHIYRTVAVKVLGTSSISINWRTGEVEVVSADDGDDLFEPFHPF